MTKDVYDPGGRELPYIPKQDVDALAWGGDFGASGTHVSIAYAGTNRIASITAYGENAQGGTTDAPVALTGVDSAILFEQHTPINLAKPITADRYGVSVITNADGSVTVKGTATDETWPRLVEVNIPSAIIAGDITISLSSPASVKMQFQAMTPDGRKESYGLSAGSTSITVKIKSGYTGMHIFLSLLPDQTIDETFHIMIAQGTEPVPFVPYVEPSITHLPIPRPLHKVGDVRDICRTRVKSVYDKRVVFAGTENWQWNDSGAWAYITKFLLDNNTGIAPACSHYQGNGAEIPAANQVVINEFGSLIIKDPSWKSVADAKAYLAAQKAAGTPVQIVYQLATPETYATDPVDFDNAAGPLTVLTGGEVEVRMTELVGSRSDVSNNTVAFSEAAQDADIQTGEKLTVLFGKIKKRFSVLASTVMMKSVFTQVGNPNLLGNSDFKIWQRGTTFTSPLPSNTYTADRWRNGSGQVTFEKTSNGAKQVGAAVANCELMAQRIEHENGTFDFTFQMKLKSDGPFYLALLSGDGRYQSELFQAKSDFTVCTATFQNVAVTGNIHQVWFGQRNTPDRGSDVGKAGARNCGHAVCAERLRCGVGGVPALLLEKRNAREHLQNDRHTGRLLPQHGVFPCSDADRSDSNDFE